MIPLDLALVREYVNEHVDTFHADRVKSVTKTTLQKVIDKNPYLSKVKNVSLASQLVQGALSARLSSSEEELFGNFLEDLAIFIAESTTGGHKSGVQGVDLEFDYDGIHYFISIKSGSSWGNRSQQDKLEEDLKKAVQVYKQRKGQKYQAEAVLGICYGKTKTNRLRGYIKLVGQNFWTFISGNKNLYKEIIDPIGYRAKEHNDAYEAALANITNKLTAEFTQTYCNADYSINWDKAHWE